MMINLSNIDLPEKIVKSLDEIFNSFESIERVILFGSRARKENKKSSDIDLAIYGVDEEKVKIINRIDEINTLYSFDIIFVDNETSDKLLQQIKKDGVIIYNREKES